MAWSLRAALAAAFCLALAVGAGIYSPVAYGLAQTNTRGCFAWLYDAPAKDARIAFFGSSRIRRIRADALSAAIGAPDGSVINLAHPWIGLDLDLALARRLDASHDMDLMIFGVQPLSPELRARTEEIKPSREFEQAGTTVGSRDRKYVAGLRLQDQWADISEQSDGPLLGAWNLALIQRVRFQSSLKMFIEAVKRPDLRQELLYPYKQIGEEHGSRRVDCFRKEWSTPAAPVQEGESSARREGKDFVAAFAPPPRGEGWRDPNPEGFFSSEENTPERRQIERIVDFGKREGIKVAFFYLPAIEIPYEPERLKARFEDEFGVRLLAPDKQLHQMLARGAYEDATHLNTQGRETLEPWLVEEIRRLLSDTDA